MDTINISRHSTGLTKLSLSHRLPVEEIVNRILQHGIDREYEVFDWSPSPLPEIEPVPVEAFPADPVPESRSA